MSRAPLQAAVPAQLRALASPQVGIVPALEECMAAPDDPRLIRVSCELAAGEGLLGTSLGHAGGMGGTGFSRAEAVAAAIGEAAERYSASYLPRERLVLATASKLGAGAASPGSFALFHESQYDQPNFPFVPFTRDVRTHWVGGINLATGEPAWLPAELVFLSPPEPGSSSRIGYATSSGMACAHSWTAATERGLLELLERDAFMITWANKLSLPRLDWSKAEEIRAIDEKYFAPTGLDYVAIDLSAFHALPIVLAVVRARGTGGALGVGAAAATNVLRASWKALSEAFASRSAGWKLALVRPERGFAADGSDVLTFEDHIQYYSDERNAEHADFLAASISTRDVRSVPELDGGDRGLIATLVARIERAGSNAYAVDVTSPDVAATGLRVVKTVAPGLCMLDVPHWARFLGASRLRDVSQRAGLTTHTFTPDDLNPWPHPFP